MLILVGAAGIVLALFGVSAWGIGALMKRGYYLGEATIDVPES